MQGGTTKGLFLLALLFASSRAEDVVSSEDLKPGVPEEDSKSAALAESSAYSEAESSENDNVGEPAGGTVAKSAASAAAYANGGQGSAQANAQSSAQDSRPGWPSPGSSGSSALAEAIAQTGGLNGAQPSPYQPGYDLNSYGSSAQAKAEATANSGLGGNFLSPNLYGAGNGYPLNLGSGSSSAQAKAEAQSSANGGGAGLYPGLNYLQGGGGSASAQAEAQAQSGGGYGSVVSPYQNVYQQPYQVYPGQGSNSLAQAQAHAEAVSQLGGGNVLAPSYPGYQYPVAQPGLNSASALADAQAISGGYGSAEANAQAQAFANAQSSATAGTDAYSRVIPLHEYIIPHLIPGAEETIVCRREGELHYFWSSAYQCLVCTCIRELGVFRAVCARCDGCMSPAPVPEPLPEPEPIPYPVTIAPVPPTPQVTCNPLPSGQPFQNPLNPCQICICRETVNWQGEPDVHIDCQQNPECVIPPDVTTLPNIPVPIPLPICDKFPPNVIFPHPTDACKVCKCIVEPIGLGILEPRITCMTLPECLPRPIPPLPTPPPEPFTLPPLPMPVPMPPEPIPWPPATTPAPFPGPHPGPGPLPGPAPHESCRPFPPNAPFQHPWDECQVCVCTEAFSYGRITIEVNCFTKKACCYEPPYPEPITIAPGPYLPSPTIQIIDKICEYRSFGVEFVNPADKCSVCTCELQGNLVTSFCRRSQSPECLVIFYPGGGSSSAEAQASAISQTGSLPSSYNPLALNGGQSQASAEANAYAQTSGLQQQPGLQSWLQPGVQQIQPDTMWLQPGIQKIQPDVTWKQPGMQPIQPDLTWIQPGMQQIQPDVTWIQPGMQQIQPDVTWIQPGMQQIQPDVTWIQPGMQQIQPDVTWIQPGMQQIQPDVTWIQPGIQQVQPDVTWIQPGVQQIQPEITWLQPGIQEVEPELSWLQSGVQQIQPELQMGQLNVLHGRPGQSQYYQVPGWELGQSGGSQASASALAEAQANQNQLPELGYVPPLYNSLGPSQVNLNPYLQSNPSAVAEAEALASAMQGYQTQYLGNNLGTSQYQLPYQVNQLGGLGSTQLGGAYNMPLVSPASYGQLGGGGIRGPGSAALAEAEALANVLSPSYGSLGQGGSASAEAKANAQAGSSGGGLYPGGSPMMYYQNPYLRPGYQTSSASAQAKALGSNAQSQASASANAIRKQGKSAQEDIEENVGETVIKRTKPDLAMLPDERDIFNIFLRGTISNEMS